MTIACKSLLSLLILILISEHDFEEQLQLNLCGYHEDTLCILATSPFQFYNDSTYHLAWFLLNSVYNSTALDDLELIRSENFDLSNEVLDTLDDRLYSALTHLEVQIPEYWTVLGDSKTSGMHRLSGQFGGKFGG